MFSRVLLALVLAGTVSAQDGGPPAGSAAWTPVIHPLPTTARTPSAQPQLSVSDRGVILSWIEREGARASLKFAERTTRGWSEPRLVASGEDWFVNWADVPSVVRLASGELVAHWLQKSGADTYAYDVRLAHSSDEGKTWSAPFSPHHDGTRTEHGFASLVQMPGAGLGVAWLDGRAMMPESTGNGHGATAGRGAMSVRFATFDRTWKQTADMPVDTRVCECCPTSVAVTTEGPIVAFRNRSEDETRDIHVSRFDRGKWTGSRAVHEDGWQIAACPVNGPMLSARGRDVAAAWFTGRGEQGRAFVAFSSDGGRTFGVPVRLDDAGALGRVDVELMSDGTAVATWIEFADQRAQFRIRRVDRTGARSDAVTIAGLQGTRASGYPRLASHGGELILAWTEQVEGGTQIRTAVTSEPGSAAR